jgi:nucleotide-binding universal stress UspA family protein
MYRAILVPVDGSPFSERALPYARMIATLGGAKVLLFRVIPPAEGDSQHADEAGRAQLVREARSYLDELAARLPDLSVETAVAEGDAADVIVEEIGKKSVDLIIMTTHGRSGLGRWVYGSVADEIMRRATVPALLVPADCQFRWPSDRAPRILVPLDGSDLSEEVLGPVCDLASVLGAELRLIRVVEPHPAAFSDPSMYMMLDPTPELEASRSYLDAVANELRAAGRDVAVQEVFGFAVTTITDEAREQNADLIAMSTHGSSGLTRLIMGSVATGVVQRATVPILIIRPVSARQQEGDDDTSTAKRPGEPSTADAHGRS